MKNRLKLNIRMFLKINFEAIIIIQKTNLNKNLCILISKCRIYFDKTKYKYFMIDEGKVLQ